MLFYRTVISSGLIALFTIVGCANSESHDPSGSDSMAMAVNSLEPSSAEAEAMVLAQAEDQLYGASADSPRREYLFESRFGIVTRDPFRWMENPDDRELSLWIEAQNAATKAYLAGELYEQVASELRASLGLEAERSAARIMADSRRGQEWQHTMRRFRPDLESGQESSILAMSPQSSYYVQMRSDSSSDLRLLQVVDADTGQLRQDVLRVKFAQVVWEGEESFLYVTDRDGRIGDTRMAIFRHIVGTSQPEDQLLYQEEERGTSISLFRSGERWLLFRGKGYGTSIGEIDLETGVVTPILPHAPGMLSRIGGDGETLYMINYRNAPLGEISQLDLRSGAITPVMPQQEHAIDRALVKGSSLYVTLVEDTASRLVRYDMESQEVRDIDLPFAGTVYLFDVGSVVLVFIGSYSRDFALWSYDPAADEMSLIFDGEPLPGDLESFRTYYRAHNGQRTPIWIVKSKDVELTPDTPVLLSGYGGFTVNTMPVPDPRSASWFERGGVRAYVTLPGGLEYGEPWHQAGMLHNKSNVFRDFAAAARHLIAMGYTSPGRLAAEGGSNGGLLVGAVINRYPELFRAAVPAVGVMDMTRYSLFTGGKWWVSEYGDRNNEADYRNLLSISPYHNIRARAYPSVLVTTADFDDRVVPAHSFKYAARLQAMQQGPNPILLHTKRWGSHSSFSGTPDERIKGMALTWTFLMKELGME